MKFISKITFLCNCSFIAAALCRWIENTNKKKGVFDGAIKLQPLESTIVILGYGAIFVNLAFNVICLLVYFFKRKLPIPNWLIYVNFLFLLAQIYYYFFTS